MRESQPLRAGGSSRCETRASNCSAEVPLGSLCDGKIEIALKLEVHLRFAQVHQLYMTGCQDGN